MTPAEWEAEKARIEERRRDLTVLIRNYTNALDGQIATVVDLHLPYPPKPEKTVTLECGHTYRLRYGRYDVQGSSGWVDSGWRESDIRALASLLPENQET